MAILMGGETDGVTEAGGAPRTYTAALVVLATVFFMWGFATVLNDILIPHLKSAFQLDYAQVLLIQFVFFLAYFVMAMPSAKILERTGYKLAVVIGLFGMAVSAAGFIPAAMLESFGLFLVALFLLAASITLLQVAANPYVAVIGPAQTASSRLNLVQAFNSAGTMLAPLFGSLLILGHTAPAARAAHPSAAARAAGVHTVELPYAIIALVLLGLAVLVWRVRLPDLGKETRRAARAERSQQSLWRHRNLVFGVPAIALYLICEVGIGSTLVNFMSLPTIGALTHARAAEYLTLYWGGAMAGRFVGAWFLRWMRPQRVLAAVTVGALALVGLAILSTGHVAMWSLLAVGLCNSIMFPTIFTLGIRGLGPLTEEGSGLLIMAIAGGGLAELQGVLADSIGLHLSYVLPWVCYGYVLFYALWGYRATGAVHDEPLSAS
ncbi:MAG: sugar MFS transporter [Pseudomonadota bacterium]|jgi:FHS family L-fucose permease-like MFS transporter|nr:sugar MFS transporter [Pseudomonadota bacterium]